MKIKLIEELQRNKELMGLNEETSPIHISVSKDGTVNFWDLKTKKVYRYKLVAVVGGKKYIYITHYTLFFNALHKYTPWSVKKKLYVKTR